MIQLYLSNHDGGQIKGEKMSLAAMPVFWVSKSLKPLIEAYREKYPRLLNAPLSEEEWRDLVNLIKEKNG